MATTAPTASSSAYSAPYTPLANSIISILSAASMPYPGPDSSTSSASISISSSTGTTFLIITTSATHHPAETSAAARHVRPSGSLAPGTAAGAGIAAGLGVLLVGILAALLLRRRRRRRQRDSELPIETASAKVDDSPSSSSDSKVEVQQVWFKAEKDIDRERSEAPDTSPSRSEAPDTSPGGQVNEADSDSQRAELAGPWAAAELDGGYTPAEMEAWSRKGNGDVEKDRPATPK